MGKKETKQISMIAVCRGMLDACRTEAEIMKKSKTEFLNASKEPCKQDYFYRDWDNAYYGICSILGAMYVTGLIDMRRRKRLEKLLFSEDVMIHV